jgi:hypothetical protein
MLVIIMSPLILSRLPLLLLVLESTRRNAGPLIMRLPRDVEVIVVVVVVFKADKEERRCCCCS